MTQTETTRQENEELTAFDRTLQQITDNDSTLTKISFSKEEFIDNIETLCLALQENKTLKSISFAGCQLSGEDAARIFSALNNIKSLRYLDFSDNKIDLSGINEIARLLRKNNAIQEINFGENPVCSKGMNLLFRSLELNHALRTIEFSHEKILAFIESQYNHDHYDYSMCRKKTFKISPIIKLPKYEEWLKNNVAYFNFSAHHILNYYNKNYFPNSKNIRITKELDRKLNTKNKLHGFTHEWVYKTIELHALLDNFYDFLNTVLSLLEEAEKRTSKKLNAHETIEEATLKIKTINSELNLSYKENFVEELIDDLTKVFDKINNAQQLNWERLQTPNNFNPEVLLLAISLSLKDKAKQLIQCYTLNSQNSCFLDCQDGKGNTALHVALLKRDRELVRELVSAGSDLTIKNNHGQCALALFKTTYQKETDSFCDFLGKGAVNHQVRQAVVSFSFCELLTCPETKALYKKPILSTDSQTYEFSKVQDLVLERKGRKLPETVFMTKFTANSLVSELVSAYKELKNSPKDLMHRFSELLPHSASERKGNKLLSKIYQAYQKQLERFPELQQALPANEERAIVNYIPSNHYAFKM